MPNKKKYGVSISEMRANLDTIARENFYFDTLLCCDEMMFEWSGLPDTIDEKHLEDYLNISGCAGFGQVGENYYIAPYAARTGAADQYGEGTRMNATTPNGIEINGEIGVDCVIIYNNTARQPQKDLIFSSMAYTEIDKSSNSNVIFARIAPIFATSDKNISAAIKDMLEKIIAGDLEIVTSENVFDDLQIDNTDALKSIDITHPERIQYLQYLSEYYDIITRRHFARRGLTLKTSAKHAQVSQDEVHGLDSVSWYYPLNKLKARRDAVAIINKIFNLNISVKFSDIWEQEYQAYLLRILKTDNENERGVENDLESVDSAANGETNGNTVQGKSDN